MKAANTQELLREYAGTGAEGAFRELVTRYVGLVYATALRLVGGDAAQAEDVTQIVFLHLAKNAHRLTGPTALGGWLHRDTCNVAATVMRSERRRRARERQAMEMNIQEDHSTANLERIAPVLDEAINRLGVEDRLAILLRFFEHYEFRALGESLGTSEEAARMRVNRALAKLQVLLRQRGVTISVLALGGALAGENLTAAPAGLGGSISAAVLAGCAAGTNTLITLISIMTAKTKMAAAAVIIISLTAGLGLLARHKPPILPQPTENQPAKADATGGEQRTAREEAPDGSSPSRPSRQIQAGIAGLWQALHEEPVDQNGTVTTQKIAEALRAFGSNKALAIPTLLAGLQDPDKTGTVQMCSAWGLWMLGKDIEGAIPELLNLAEAKAQPHNTRANALEALGTALETAAHQTSPDTESIARIFPEVTSLLGDEDPGVRMEAAGALGKMGNLAKAAVPALSQMLAYSASAEDARMQVELEGGDTSNLDPAKLEKEMERVTKSMRLSALSALEGIGQDAQTAAPLVTTLLSGPDKGLQAEAAIALWRMTGSAEGAPILAESIYPPAPDPVWQRKVDTLGEMGPAAAAAVPTLQRLCKFTNEEIHQPAMAALEKIDPATAAQMSVPEKR